MKMGSGANPLPPKSFRMLLRAKVGPLSSGGMVHIAPIAPPPPSPNVSARLKCWLFVSNAAKYY